MAAERSTLAYTTPTLGNITAKIFQSAEHIKTLAKNEVTYPANTYDDVDKYGFHPSNLFWAVGDTYYSARQPDQPEYVKEFLSYDPNAPLRGNYKRTEVGVMFPDELTASDMPKPGDALTTPKQYYVPIWQDSSRPLEDIHLRALVDDHAFDFVKHFNNHAEYFHIRDTIHLSINKAIERVETLCVDAFLLALFGGHLHSYPVGSTLYRFFADNNGWVPDQAFSKLANKYYKHDGELAKTVKEIANWATKTYTSKKAYLTNIVRSEIPAQRGKDVDVPKFSSALLPDFSTKEKALETARDWYLQKEGNTEQWKKVPELLRRQCLMAYVGTLKNVINRMKTEDVRNHAAYDHYGDNTDKILYPLMAKASQLMVFMNQDDYEDLRDNLLGSPASGVFTERPNGELGGLINQGVRFYGLPFIMPGCAAIIDRLGFSLKEYFALDAKENRPYHLVESWIKHVKKKPVMFEHVVYEAICPAKGQKFMPGAGWASENLPLLVKDA